MIDIHSHIRKKDKQYDVVSQLLDMDRFSIDKRVISTREGETILTSLQDIVKIVQQHPTRFIGCAYLNPALKSVVDDLQYALSQEEIRMIEFNSYEDGFAPDNCEVLDVLFGMIEKKKMAVKVFTGLGSKSIPQQWEIYVKKYPNIQFVFLHMGCFDYGYSCVDVVKRNENAYIETSNQYENQILKKAFTQLDVKKIVFGSSYPSRFTRNAIEIFDLFDFSEEAKQCIFEKNAKMILSV